MYIFYRATYVRSVYYISKLASYYFGYISLVREWEIKHFIGYKIYRIHTVETVKITNI